MSKMTPWFEGTVPPARSGVYELKHTPVGFSYAFFHRGLHTWYVGADTVEDAIRYATKMFVQSVCPQPAERYALCWEWRGFTKEQKA